jgi:formate--tetrahydrofolate ligase
MHGGVAQEDLEKENVEAMLAGASNLEKHIDSISQYHVPYIVAINKFAKDTPAEVEALLNWCREKGYPVEESDGWAKGGEGTKELASHVVKLCEEPNAFAPLYDVNDSIENKISLIAQKIYGADGAEFSPEAEEKIAFYKEQGWDRLPICMAKTQSSLSDNPDLKGRPTGFVIHVRDLSISKGAGFIVAYTGSILTMPGLPKDPAALHMGIDENGNSYGIF